MRRIQRAPLPPADVLSLAKRQRKADGQRAAGQLAVTPTWRAARKTKLLRRIHGTLCSMAGARERCMYCLDSHGTDIEHFWPKAPYPGRMFRWENLLLCCAECGRIKGTKFPLDANGAPMLLDPTVDEPWRHLDFDPQTGIVTAAFDVGSAALDPRGKETVELLGLEQREALQVGQRRTWNRLASRLEVALRSASIKPHVLVADLQLDDEHGLLPWCFSARGGRVKPFADLLARDPSVFAVCAKLVGVP